MDAGYGPVRARTVEEIISRKKGKKVKKRRAETNGSLATLPRQRRGAEVRDYDAHVLFCGGGDCKKRGSKEVRKALKAELRERGMVGDVRIDSTGCLGLCKHGPNAVVYPGGTWYLGLTEGDVPEVVERHLEGGEPVEQLAAVFRPRKKKRK
jgi:(2Fe-2S) ferredoxin